MTKINYNLSIINASFLPSLNTASDYLNKALKIARGMYIPSGFRYSAYLNDLKNDISSNINKVNKVIELINTNGKYYDNIAYECNSEIAMIQDVKITKRESAIK